MFFSELIDRAGGYLPDAYLKKAYITRQNRDGSLNYINLNLLSSQEYSIKLENWDHIHIYSQWDLMIENSVNISGMVPKPGNIPIQFAVTIKIKIVIDRGRNLRAFSGPAILVASSRKNSMIDSKKFCNP